jgi:ketosteroid isomerase-like protein
MRAIQIASALAANLLVSGATLAQITESTPAPQRSSATMQADLRLEVTPTGQSTGPTASSDRAAIGHSEQVVAVSTNLNEVLSYYAKNATLENVSPGEIHGTAAIGKDLQKFFTAYPSFEAHIKKIDITSDGRLGYAWSIQHVTAKGKNDLPDIDLIFRCTDLYKKENGRWLIVYQHVSVPVDLTTGKAAYGG